MCCSVWQCVAVCCSVLQCVAECCSVMQCVAVCCSVLQCVAVCCSVLQCRGEMQESKEERLHCWALLLTATQILLPPLTCTQIHTHIHTHARACTHMHTHTFTLMRSAPGSSGGLVKTASTSRILCCQCQFNLNALTGLRFTANTELICLQHMWHTHQWHTTCVRRVSKKTT